MNHRPDLHIQTPLAVHCKTRNSLKFYKEETGFSDCGKSGTGVENTAAGYSSAQGEYQPCRTSSLK